MGFRPGVDTKPAPLVVSKYNERSAVVSPDGRWLAYESNETGRSEIYVVPFPNTTTAKWPVSTEGGYEPEWSHRGTELFFRNRAGFMVAVDVKTTPTFSIGSATRLFPVGDFAQGLATNSTHQYVVGPDDKRFLFIRPIGAQSGEHLTVVENWVEELKAIKRKP